MKIEALTTRGLGPERGVYAAFTPLQAPNSEAI
jgi:hypothetical protein